MDPLKLLASQDSDWPMPKLSRDIELPFINIDGTYFHYKQSHISCGDKELLLIGTSHTTDPEHPELPLIEDAILSFSPTIILTEALPEERQLNPTTVVAAPTKFFASLQEALYRCGESGYSAFIAQDSAIACTPESSVNDQINNLEALGFSRDDIFSYFGFRWNLQIQGQSSIEQHFEAFHRGQSRLGGTALENFLTDNTLTAANAWAQARWGRVSFGSQEWGNIYFCPVWGRLSPESVTVTNLVVEASCYLRDLDLLRATSFAALHHDRIAVIYGCQHVVTCESSLPYALEHPGFRFGRDN